MRRSGVPSLSGSPSLGAAVDAAGSAPAGVGGGDAAAKVYVAPGQNDEFYAFMSGGFSGNVPSTDCRRAGC